MPFVVHFCEGEKDDGGVLRDARRIRQTVFVQEQGVPQHIEFDGKDDAAIHFVLYSSTHDTDENEKKEDAAEASLRPKHMETTDTQRPAGSARLRRVTHCGYRDYAETVMKVERVCVLPSYRGMGCGALLMRAVERYVMRHHANTSLVMHAQVSSKAFYKRLGWSEASEEFVEANIPHLIMSKL